MGLVEFLNHYKTTDSKNETVSSMKGGKYKIPSNECKRFYKLIRKSLSKGEELPPLTEKIGKYHPLIFDFDLKYIENIDKQYLSLKFLKSLSEFLWICINDIIDVSDEAKYNTLYIMTKSKPYPCKKQGYQSKDGIHLVFPKIILDRDVYKILCNYIQEKQDEMFSIFKDDCEIPPSNLDDTLCDGKFSRWLPYLCHKEGEESYKLKYVFIMTQGNSEQKNQSLIDGPTTFYTDEKLMNDMSMIREGLNENVCYTEYTQTKLKSKSTNSSKMVSEGIPDTEDVYAAYYVDNNNVINPYKIVEEEKLKYVEGLVKCLSDKRATEYDPWLSVGFCLHNINTNLLDEWKKFSSLSSSYDESSCDKQWTLNDKSNFDGHKYGIGSLVKWAKEDNEELFDKVKRESVETFVHKSVVNGTDADFLIAKVIHKFFEDEYMSMNVKDEWYYFNGIRWERTVEGTKLRMAIHEKVWKIYHEYEPKYVELKQNAMNNAESDDERQDIQEGKTKEGRWLKNIMNIKMKLLKDSYVTTLINSLRNLFYKKDIAEEFDSDVNTLGFENGIIDLKEGIFREGRPEDYITKTTNYSIDYGETKLPVKVSNLQDILSRQIPNYSILKIDLIEFIEQIMPIKEVRDYTIRFLSKCLSGENRDEGFYIWTGSGGNGKSKLIELMQLVLGDYAGGLPVSLITSKRSSSNSATPEMARTKGLRFVVMQEPEANECINIGLMKELTGNDKIIARGLFKEPIEFIPQFKMLLMCNDLPAIPSNDDGTWRRLEVVDFISRFVDDKNKLDDSKHVYRRDKSLRAKLRAWPTIFLSILLEEWLKYDKEGIIIPPQVNNKTKSYRNENDIVGQWIDQMCELCDNIPQSNGLELAPTCFGDLEYEFKQWCQEQGYKVPDKKKTKDDLLKWQDKSKYGLSLGRYKKDGRPNGTMGYPSFNLKVIKEE